MGKASLYFNTVKSMKPSQVFNRARIKLGNSCKLGVIPSDIITEPRIIKSPEALDFDPVFLARFPVDELMANKITILHSSKVFDWKSRWQFDDKSALWNFNLHYFEYLFPLIKIWKEIGEKKYLDKMVEMINGWIDNNPKGSVPGWSSYPTALRIVNWISWYEYVNDAIDEVFRKKFLSSLHVQFVYLSSHLEKDILGNHYFEDLKSLVMGALFFNDEDLLKKALADFKAECKEEILPDGMHFELSPMYHKIIFEGILRVVMALRGGGRKDSEIESYLQPMLDVAYSFENGLDRVPLFNDGGNNVAKSLNALLNTASQFGLSPHFKASLETSGFFIFEKNVSEHEWKLVVDAGQPGPKYIPGHAQCDAMSYELFRDGKPVVVNCGTYAYQCKERGFFRSTAAHNTVKLNGTEQSQCWGAFRLAKRSKVKVLKKTDSSLVVEMIDAAGNKCQRTLLIRDNYIEIRDKAEGCSIESFVHNVLSVHVLCENSCRQEVQPYAPDYGEKTDINCNIYSDRDQVEYKIVMK